MLTIIKISKFLSKRKRLILESNEITDGSSLDLIDVAKNLAKEKGIKANEVVEAMESAIAKAGRTKYGYDLDIRSKIDEKTGKIGLFRYQEIVNNINEFPLEERANKINLNEIPKESNLVIRI